MRIWDEFAALSSRSAAVGIHPTEFHHTDRITAGGRPVWLGATATPPRAAFAFATLRSCDGLCRQTSAVSAPTAALSRRLRFERCMAHATCQAAWRMPCGIGARYPPLRPTARETRAHGARAHPAAPAGENTPNHWRVQCRAAVAIRSRRARRVRSDHRIECAPCTMQHTFGSMRRMRRSQHTTRGPCGFSYAFACGVAPCTMDAASDQRPRPRLLDNARVAQR